MQTCLACPSLYHRLCFLARLTQQVCVVCLQVARGRADAFAWAEAVGFTHNGMPVFPTTTLFNTLPRQLLDAGIPSPAVA